MEWYQVLMTLVTIAVFAVPVVMLVLIGIYVLLLPCGFLAGLLMRLGDPPERIPHGRSTPGLGRA